MKISLVILFSSPSLQRDVWHNASVKIGAVAIEIAVTAIWVLDSFYMYLSLNACFFAVAAQLFLAF